MHILAHRLDRLSTALGAAPSGAKCKGRKEGKEGRKDDKSTEEEEEAEEEEEEAELRAF